MTTIDYHSLPNGNGVGVVIKSGEPAAGDEHRKYTPGQPQGRTPGPGNPAQRRVQGFPRRPADQSRPKSGVSALLIRWSLVQVQHGSLEPPQNGGFLFGRIGPVSYT